MKNDTNRTECRGKIIALVAAASFALVLATSANAKWIDIGPGSLNLVNTQNAYSPSITSLNNTLYFSWSEEEFTGVTTRKGMYVKRYNGAWSRVGGVLNIGNTQNAEGSAIGVSSVTGYPIVAWTEREYYDASSSTWRSGVYVKGYNGTAWSQYGTCLNVGNTQTASYNSPNYSVNMVVNGITPFVSWMEYEYWNGRFFNQFVKHYNNPDWVLDGNTRLNTNNMVGNTFAASLAYDGQRTVSAYADGDRRVYVKAFNGSTLTWDQIGGAVNTGTADYNQSVVCGWGNTYVAYCESYPTVDPRLGVYVRRLNGSSWELMGTKLNISYTAYGYSPSIGMNGSTPFVAWQENGKIYVKYWNGTSWTELLEENLGLNVDQNKQAYAPKVAVRNNAPYVTWFEINGASPAKYQIYCKFYASPTATLTMTPTYTCTSTITPTRTITRTFTVTPTVTMTPTLTPTYTVTPTVTLTITTTATATMTPYQLEEGKVITYPSPGKGKELWFYYKVGGPCQAKIDIFNLLGEKAQTLENQHVEAGYGRTRWDISSVAPGIYIFRLTLESATETKKFKPSKLVIVR